MNYITTQKPSYTTEFIELPRDLQKRVVAAIAELEEDPIAPRGNTIKPLTGYDNVWRYRLGDHRLIYAVAADARIVQLLAIGPRGEIYERFNYDGWDDESYTVTFSRELARQLEPQKEKAPEWTRHPEWFRKKQRAKEKGDKNWLPRRITLEMLERLQVPERYHDAFLRCQTEEELLNADAPHEFVTRVMDVIYPPSVEKIAQQPDLVLFDPADLERYAEGTLTTFLLHLDERQRPLVDWALAGPTLVKGGPGSGKSTVALYRIRVLVEEMLEKGQRAPEILFTTYTNALVNVSDTLLRQLLRDPMNISPDEELPPEITVSTVDKIVYQIVRETGHSVDIAGRRERQEALRYARRSQHGLQGSDMESVLANAAVQRLRDDYLLDEFDWVIEGQDCRKLQDYLDAERVGRAIPFTHKMRAAVWDLYERYSRHLAQNKRRSWGQMRQIALQQVQAGNWTHRWDYVLVDEAQDLTPAAIALCVELARDPSGVFLTADANQSLYNKGFRWQNVHHQLRVVGRTRILRRNYRTTREIAHAAANLLTAVNGADAEALRQDYVHNGPPPQQYAAGGAADQARWLAREIMEALHDLRLPFNAAAVLVPSNRLGSSIARLLEDEGIPATYMKGREMRLDDPGVKVITLHSAKGLEFPVVAVAHVEADRLPAPTDAEDAEEIEEHMSAQRRLFYVGCTRAMRYLFVTYDRSLSSDFVRLLSEDHWLTYEA